jgi:hypothetical protein
MKRRSYFSAVPKVRPRAELIVVPDRSAGSLDFRNYLPLMPDTMPNVPHIAEGAADYPERDERRSQAEPRPPAAPANGR